MITMNEKFIFVLAGGTLGHINPALVIAKTFYNNGYKVIFISTTKFENSIYFKNTPYINKLYYLQSKGFIRKKLSKNIKNLFINIKIYFTIKNLIKLYAPVFIFGFGGSISTLGILASLSKKIKCGIHEQNAVMGLGNKIISKKVDLVFTSLMEQNSNNFIKVGNPLESYTYKRRILYQNKKNSILIFGGSNGSLKINNFTYELMKDDYINNSLYNIERVMLILGNRYKDKYKEKYNKLEVISETNEMEKLYNDSEIVVCRAGAGTLAEILGYRKLALVVPSPNVTGNHQYQNALYLQEKGCIEMLEEKDLTIENFLNKIDLLIKNKNYYLNNIDKNINMFCEDIVYYEIIKRIGGDQN